MNIVDSVKKLFTRNSYEAAGTGRRSTNVTTTDSSVNAETRQSLKILRARSRDMVRNNPYATKAVNVIVSNTIGKGIKATAKGGNSERTNNHFKKWVNDCDYDNKLDLYGLQSLIMRTMVESGECLILRSKSRKNGLKIQVLECDYLDTSMDGQTSNGELITQGVQINKKGQITGYWLYESNPSENGISTFKTGSRFIKADQIIHVFNVERAGQLRGIPWGVSGMTRLRGIDQFQDARVEQMKVAACFAGFIVDDENSGSQGDILPEKLEPAMFPKLGYGQDIKFNSPPNVSGQEEFIATELRAIASAYGVSYEALTGDFSKVNFSSGRMGWLEFQRNIERWQAIMVRAMRQIGSWYLNEYEIDDSVSLEWTPPRREMIDPTREIPAIIKMVRGGLKPWQEAIRELGYDAETVAERIKEDNELFDSLGLILDSDARKVTNAGMFQLEQENEQ